MTKKLEIELYKLTDSFLTEAKDQNGNGRSLKQLNQDRHLFVENCLTLIQTEREQAVKNALEEVEKRLPKLTLHICRFNDGDCVCECFDNCLKQIRKLINKLKTKYK